MAFNDLTALIDLTALVALISLIAVLSLISLIALIFLSVLSKGGAQHGWSDHKAYLNPGKMGC